MWSRNLKRSFQLGIPRWSRRDYLTESYGLNDVWADRLKTPTLQKVNAESLYFDIESKFSQTRKISPVDVGK